MINTLYRIIRKVIVPQYPWIKDFVWTYNSYDSGDRLYSLELIVDNNFYLNNCDASSRVYNKLYNDVVMLFKMIGPEENELFDDITISPEEI